MMQVMSRNMGSITRSNYFTQRHVWSCRGFQTTISTSVHVLFIPKYRNKSDILRKQSLRSFHTVRNMVVYSGVQPGSPLPSDPSPNSWKMWLLGMVISAILPFWANKWGPFRRFEKQVEAAVETAEHVVEIVEQVAEGVEKIAEEVADELPDGGKLKAAVTFVENVAEVAAKDAHLADEFIDKVEEVENQIESVIDPIIGQADEKTKE